MLLEYGGWIPSFPLQFPSDPNRRRRCDGVYLLGVFAAFASALWITVYFTTSIRRYVDRAHAEIRQKEKMLGIGQLVAGIAHQIANPLDGVQNCLQRIGRAGQRRRPPDRVRADDDRSPGPHRADGEAGAGLRPPRGDQLAEHRRQRRRGEHAATCWGRDHAGSPDRQGAGRRGRRSQGDPYTLQEVLFNLCTNALAAMPNGGPSPSAATPWAARTRTRWAPWPSRWPTRGSASRGSTWRRSSSPSSPPGPTRGGTGLGLGLCRMLISEMGGRIEVRSALGQGTTFTVVLNPMKPLAAVAPQPGASARLRR